MTGKTGPSRYDPDGPEDLVRLVEHNPLAWVVSGEGDSFFSTLLPLRPRLDAAGAIRAFAGHFPRHHGQAEALMRDGRAQLLFTGPAAYVSPSWMADRTQAPTWNYAAARFPVTIAFDEDAAVLGADLDDLIEAMEAGRDQPWSAAEMGERYARLSRGIIAFRAELSAPVAPRFRLGQDEGDDTYADILAGLEGQGDIEMIAWMRQANRFRQD